MIRCAWGEPAPCIDSVRYPTAAVPSVMFSMSRRTLMRCSVGTAATPRRYFSMYLPATGCLRSFSEGMVTMRPPAMSSASRAIS